MIFNFYKTNVIRLTSTEWSLKKGIKKNERQVNVTTSVLACRITNNFHFIKKKIWFRRVSGFI